MGLRPLSAEGSRTQSWELDRSRAAIPAAMLGGARGQPSEGGYPYSEVAMRHNAWAEEETRRSRRSLRAFSGWSRSRHRRSRCCNGLRGAARGDGARSDPGRGGLVRPRREGRPLAAQRPGAGSSPSSRATRSCGSRGRRQRSRAGRTDGDVPPREHAGGLPRACRRAAADRRGRGAALRQWDFFHCPPGTNHVIVGAGDGPCVVRLRRRARRRRGLGRYTVDETASVTTPGSTRRQPTPHVAYARFPSDRFTSYEEGSLPG